MKRIVIVILLVIANSVFAQKLNLKDLMDSLDTNNSEILTARAAIDISQVERQNRKYLGSTSSSLQYGQINTLTRDRYLDFDQEIVNPLRVASLKKMDAYSVKAKSIDVGNKVESIRLELLNLYVNALYTSAALDSYKVERQLFEDYLEKAKYLVQSNEISSSDYALIKIQLSQIQLEEVRLEQQFHELDEEIHRLVALPNDQEIAYSANDWDLTVIQSMNTELSTRFVDAIELNRMHAEQQQKVASVSYVPNLSLGYFNQSIEHNNGFQGVKLGLTFNLLDGSNNQAYKTAKIQEQLNRDLMEIEATQLNNRLENVRHHLEIYKVLYDELNMTSGQVRADLIDYGMSAVETGEIGPLVYIQVRQKAMEMDLTRLEVELSVRMLKNELYYLTHN